MIPGKTHWLLPDVHRYLGKGQERRLQHLAHFVVQDERNQLVYHGGTILEKFLIQIAACRA